MEGGGEPLDPTALTVEQAAKVLAAAGRRAFPEEILTEDLDEGAPANADGTINIVCYVAWLVREYGGGE